MNSPKRMSLSDFQRKAVKARWAKTTPEERSAYARKMVAAREAKRAGYVGHTHCWDQPATAPCGRLGSQHSRCCLCTEQTGNTPAL